MVVPLLTKEDVCSIGLGGHHHYHPITNTKASIHTCVLINKQKICCSFLWIFVAQVKSGWWASKSLSSQHLPHHNCHQSRCSVCTCVFSIQLYVQWIFVAETSFKLHHCGFCALHLPYSSNICIVMCAKIWKYTNSKTYIFPRPLWWLEYANQHYNTYCICYKLPCVEFVCSWL